MKKLARIIAAGVMAASVAISSVSVGAAELTYTKGEQTSAFQYEDGDKKEKYLELDEKLIDPEKLKSGAETKSEFTIKNDGKDIVLVSFRLALNDEAKKDEDTAADVWKLIDEGIDIKIYAEETAESEATASPGASASPEATQKPETATLAIDTGDGEKVLDSETTAALTALSQENPTSSPEAVSSAAPTAAAAAPTAVPTATAAPTPEPMKLVFDSAQNSVESKDNEKTIDAAYLQPGEEKSFEIVYKLNNTDNEHKDAADKLTSGMVSRAVDKDEVGEIVNGVAPTPKPTAKPTTTPTTKPATSTKSASKTTAASKTNPKTGDNAPIGLAAVMGIMSIAAIAYIYKKGKEN